MGFFNFPEEKKPSRSKKQLEGVAAPNASQVIPFGKYKGQAAEVLRSDPAYVQWLSGQDWFRDRYAIIHTLIIHNFGEPSETPEHNALQVKFWMRSSA